MQPPSRLAGLLAPLGLIAVLVALAGFATWSHLETRAATEQADRAMLENDAYQAAEHALTLQLAAQREYWFDSVHAKASFDAVAGDFVRAVERAEGLGGIDERPLATTLLGEERAYRGAFGRFVRVDRRSVKRARLLDDRIVEPLNTLMERQITGRVALSARETEDELARLHRIQDVMLVLSLVVFLLGGVLLVFFFRMLWEYRRRSDREMAALLASEDALRASEERYRRLVETSPDGIMLADATSTIVMVNRRAAELYGAKRAEELLGVNTLELMPQEEREKAVKRRPELLQNGGYSGEFVAQRFDGSRFVVEANTSLLRDQADNVTGAISILRDVTERRQAEQALAHQAMHDSLTDLPNRMLLRDRLQQAILAAERDDRTLGLLFMDLNRFKEVNDTFGHHYGDALLKQLAAVLRRTLRDTETIARLGGDEFAVLLPATDAAGVAATVQTIMAALDQPFEVDGHVFDVGASIGAAFYPEHGKDASTLMRRADVAMYAAKRAGSGWATYSPEQDENDPDRMALSRELRLALEHDQFFLHYQPQLNVKTGCAEHVEALIRWRHPERGFVAPGNFIPLAEETGLIRPITRWVLHEALRQCAAWRRQRLDIQVAVNLSARSLHDTDLVETVEEALRTWSLPATSLQVEITESAIIVDPARAMETLSRLHEMGVWIAIDDFGTGYSSLAHLKRLPVDAIKIDRSFVADMMTNSDNAFIVRSIVELGHNLGLQVVAEGVEDQTTLEELASLGCDMVQGYHLSRPLGPDTYARWLERRPERRASA